MTAVFPRWANRAARFTVAFGAATLVLAPLVAMVWVRTPLARGEGRPILQPVPFDHRVHVNGLRIDCRFCHASADRGRWAGLPATETCVACHTSAWINSSAFAPVRESMEKGQPIQWRRVTQLPDFVYFNHAIHVRKGIGCESCHGRVDQMAAVYQTAPLTMGWCLECHNNPGPSLRPLDAVTKMGWTPVSHSGARTATLVAEYQIQRLTNCSTCHR